MISSLFCIVNNIFEICISKLDYYGSIHQSDQYDLTSYILNQATLYIGKITI